MSVTVPRADETLHELAQKAVAGPGFFGSDQRPLLDLAGVDVYTLKVRVVREFLMTLPRPDQIFRHSDLDFEVTLQPPVNPQPIFDLWTIDDEAHASLKNCAVAISRS